MPSTVPTTRQTTLGDALIEYELPWNGVPFQADILAIDTETEFVEDPAIIPTLALMTVSDGQRHVVVRPEDVPSFFAQQADCHFVGQNLSFDFWVLLGYFESQQESEAIELLWRIAANHRLYDTLPFDGLLRLATDGNEPRRRNLGELAQEYLDLEIDKQDPYRKRFGELIGTDWADADRGFFEYAIRDVVATYLVFERQCELYDSLIAAMPNLAPANPAAHIGPLSLAVQVLGTIGLEKLRRNGLHLDREQLPRVQEAIRGEREHLLTDLANDPANAEIFRRDAEGRIERTESGQPRIKRKPLADRFLQAAKDIREGGTNFEVPLNASLDVSVARDDWAEHLDKDEFLDKWFSMGEKSKLLQFFEKLTTDRIHPKYAHLTRAGRTSCSDPNILLTAFQSGGAGRSNLVALGG